MKLILAVAFTGLTSLLSGQAPQAMSHAWSDASLSPDARAAMVLHEMTTDEKLSLLHGNGMPGWGKPNVNAKLGNGGAGFILGIPRLGIPFVQMSDAAYGVRSSAENGRYSTALPSNVASAASWDPAAACKYGALIGRELRAQGYNMTLGGGVNITREPRNGRTFEYLGEDPILAGTLVGNRIKCEQAQNVIGDIKHFAVNDQESGRDQIDALISRRAMRETDLLAFEIGIGIGQPGAVMCSYNAVNGDYACENKYLLTDVLKHDWGFKGFVLSDWGGTHSTVKASAAGLDNEEPEDLFYGAGMKAALASGVVPMTQVDDHVMRILRSEFADGLFDHPAQKSDVDKDAGLETSRQIAEQSIVLLRNENHILPLDRAKLHTVAIIGAHADVEMISGGGSAQVDVPGRPPTKWQEHVWFPTSPKNAVAAKAPGVTITFDSGSNVAAAAGLAAKADVALVFVHQWTSEGTDVPNLSLPDHQDALIAKVAAANPHTIVVLETGTAVTMPWINSVAGVVEAWYAGSRGADAVANVLFGDVNPSAKLPMTFPVSEADLPHPGKVKQPPSENRGGAAVSDGKGDKPTFSFAYDEGLKVGYKWYDAEKKPVLFPFGFGLSYAEFAYSGLKVTTGDSVNVTFTVTNTGKVAGTEIAEVYAALPAGAGEPPKRLVGWSKVALKPAESREVTVAVPAKYLSVFDEAGDRWKRMAGSYEMMVGPSSRTLPLTKTVELQ